MGPRVLLALLVTLVVEIPIVALVYRAERRRMAVTCAVTTGVTNLAMNALWLPLAASYAQYLLVGEVGALVVEAGVYLAVSRRHEPGRAVLASALANGASFGLGLLLFG